MNASSFLFHYGQYVAYGAAWSIHLAYLGTLMSRYGRLRREFRELRKK